MDVIWIAIILGVVLLVAAAWLLFTRSVIRRAARNILSSQQRIFGRRHEFRPANAADFPHADHAFYGQRQVELEALGFRKIADVEDISLSEFMSDSKFSDGNAPTRTFLRCMSSADGTIVAAIYHAILPAMERRDGKLRRVRVEKRIVGLETDFSDGTWIETIPIEPGELPDSPPENRRLPVPSDAPVHEIHDRHVASVAGVRSVWKAIEPVPIRTYDELVASWNHHQDMRIAHRRDVGFITERELTRFAGDNQAMVQPILREIRRLVAQQRR